MFETCERVSKTSIYLLVFLLPILFLPWTANVLDFNKQALLIVLVLISLFSWMLKVLISGKASFSFSMVHIPVLVLFIVYAASSIFSVSSHTSFWGWPSVTSEGLISILAMVILYFLIINIFERKEVFYLAVSLIVSSLIAMIYGILQLFGIFVLPMIGFTRSAAFNTIGGVNSLAVFAAILLPLVITFLTIAKASKTKILFVATALVSAALLLIINFNIAWWIVMAGSALIIIFGTQKRNAFDGRWLILPMFFLAIAMLFSFFQFRIPGVPDMPAELFLNQKASLDISWTAVQENPVLGSGPGTFKYNFTRFKDVDFNNGNLWNLKFDWAASKFLTILGTIGILGALAFLAMVVTFIFYGIKFLMGKSYQKADDDSDQPDDFYWTLGMGVFMSFLAATTAFFLFRSNLSIDFAYFVLMACFVALLYPIKKEVVLKSSSLLTLGVTFGFTLIFIFGLGILILEGQRYVSATSYLKSIEAAQENRIDDAIAGLETALRISPKDDIYWREIAQVYLAAVNSVRNNSGLNAEESSRIAQRYINGAVNAAKSATEANPNNTDNWSVRGSVYQNLIGIVGGTKDWSVSAYEEAARLEPTNPFFPNQIGISLMREARNTQDAAERSNLIEEAKAKFNEAIALKSDYAAAHFQLALAYQTEGDQSAMVASLEKTKEVAPFDVGLAFQLGVVYYQMDNLEKARTEFERAVLLNPNYANALYFLGLIYDEFGQTDSAIAVFERLIANNPDNGVAIQVLKNLRSGKGALEGLGGQVPSETEELPIVEDIEEEIKEEIGE